MFNPVEKLKEFIRCASISTDSSAKAGMAAARDLVVDLLKSSGFKVDVVSIPTGVHPVICAHRGGDESWPHVIVYGHYDVQPADPLNLWESPAFEPEIRGGRIYGRGAADNKGPLLVHIAAITKLLEREPNLPLQITFVIEGEEEMGSPSFLPFLEQYKDRLGKADCVILSDTGSPREDQLVVTCGLRGLMLLDLIVTGPKMDLHSGLHGGVLRNPIQALTEVCASLHSPDGRVNVPGFYDDVLPVEQWERDELTKFGQSEEEYREFLGIPAFHPAKDYTPFEATRYGPTLEFNGIGGGYQGEGTKTVIPSKAFVKISCRLVSNQDPVKIRELVYNTIKERMPKDVTFELVNQHDAQAYVVVPPDRSNTPKDQSPVLARAFRATDSAVKEVFGNAPLYLREGGSVPIIADIKRVLGLDSMMLGLFLPEDNLHAPNESFHLGVMEKGILAVEKVYEKIARG
ncbi:acetylornithine deacetylase/succinyl-diaminopimelate desuccinylase-like protein [Ereboglobus sp. PH5-5]|uniref:M20/M25/M40 family metallo-hydrolase n=1 Tax=Ereboglobus sp. PH5-5 TaxID=2940529 RepID=UPI0024065D7A|nr:M20/M25/M40 family metallo-hydrolase [Ereboglobus sp. PH5-5]MDF9833497.1 acetylornithine deacetylase/succinyl-diaminopimelate desuccinylase-like protein [Ereboglobus sp. PH5-5]